MADYDRYSRNSRGQYQGERARREDTDYRSGAYGEYVDRPRNRDRDDDRRYGRDDDRSLGDRVRGFFRDDDDDHRDRVFRDDRRFRDSDYRSYRGDAFGGRAYGSGRDEDDSDRGRGYGDRNWAERQGDEVRSWFGDDEAERRRERDRQTMGRYPGERPGERLSDNLGGRAEYDRRYGDDDRQGWRASPSYGSARSENRYGGQPGYGGDDGYRQSGFSGQQSFGGTGNYRQQSRDQNYGQGERFGRTQGDQSGYGGQVRSSQGDTGRSPHQSAYGSYGGEGRYDSGPRTDMAGPGAYSQSPTGGAYGQSGFQAARNVGSSYGDRHDGHSSSSYGERHVTNERSNSDERGFLTRAADEVRSWFGDDDAERRRERDQASEGSRDDFRGSDNRSSGSSFGAATRFSSASSSHAHDPHYAEYRSQRAAELDREYDEYKKHRSGEPGQDFTSWRTSRTQAGSSAATNDSKGVREHQRVLSRDGDPIGAVDKIQGADIKLTRKDSTDGKHHLIPLSWVERVDGHDVHLTKTADEVRREWRDAPEQPQGQVGQLNSGLAGSLQKGQDTTTSATSGAHATTGTTASGAV